MAQGNAVVPIRAADSIDDEAMWKLVASGDLRGLTDPQKTRYYLHLCDTIGVNPATQPFEYMDINGKYILYAKPTLTDQLRKIHGVSVIGKPSINDDGKYITAEVMVQDTTGRTDYDIGVVFIGDVEGERRANARMKALTKGKRRATLRICGLSALDESEVETVPGARPVAFVPSIASEPQQQPARPSRQPTDRQEHMLDVAWQHREEAKKAIAAGDDDTAIAAGAVAIIAQGFAETVDREKGEIRDAESRVIDHDPADLGLVKWLIQRCNKEGITGDDWQRRWWHGEYGLREVDGHLSRKTISVAHAEALKSMLLQDPHRAKTMASPYRADPTATPAEPPAEPDDREARLIYLRELMIGGSWPELVTEAGDDEAAWVAMALAVEDLSQHSRLVAEAKRAGKLTALVSAAASDRAKQLAAKTP